MSFLYLLSTKQDAIITSLQEYNSHIETLKEEMDEATGSAEEIRKEIQSFRNKYVFVMFGTLMKITNVKYDHY
jgi:uncharacterized coiled-coil DUF342 family protein